MKAVVQRVTSASVEVEGALISEIGPGVLTLLGVEKGDTEKDAEWLMKKIAQLRIFEDESGKMNLSALDLKYEQLLVSQFTLLGDTKKGNRPSFIQAAPPDEANRLYEYALRFCESLGLTTKPGKFQTHMKVSLLNDGPVTLLLDSN